MSESGLQLYGDERAVKEVCEMVKRVAPWANGKVEFADKEIGYAVRQCAALGLNPLDPHEVQVFKDKHGIHVSLSYALIVGWLRRFYGGFTTPQYRDLTQEEMTAEGLNPTDYAVEVRFLMLQEVPTLTALVQAGYDPNEARGMVEVHGIGVVSGDDWRSPYFAPNGRSKRWKVEKRAFTAAVRAKYGTPSRDQIEILRRDGGMADVEAEDWELPPNLTPGGVDNRGRAALAAQHAHYRLTDERREADPAFAAEQDATNAAAIAAMYPNTPGAAPDEPVPPEPVEGEIVEETEVEEIQEPQAPAAGSPEGLAGQWLTGGGVPYSQLSRQQRLDARAWLQAHRDGATDADAKIDALTLLIDRAQAG